MKHWMRKHVDEMEWVAEQCANGGVIPAWQEAFLKKVKNMAHSARHNESSCTLERVGEMITMLCSACRGGLPGQPVPECPGRLEWSEDCDLIRRMPRQKAD